MKKNSNHHTLQLPAGAGKCNTELRRITHASESGKNPRPRSRIVYVISRDEIESDSIDRILGTLGSGVPPGRLRGLRGKVTFAIEGYDDEDDELYALPAVRKYISRLNDEWCGWFYFVDLRCPFLMLVACALAENLTSARRKSDRAHEVILRRDELDEWGNFCSKILAMIDHYTRVSTRSGIRRMLQIEHYFGTRHKHAKG